MLAPGDQRLARPLEARLANRDPIADGLVLAGDQIKMLAGGIDDDGADRLIGRIFDRLALELLGHLFDRHGRDVELIVGLGRIDPLDQLRRLRQIGRLDGRGRARSGQGRVHHAGRKRQGQAGRGNKAEGKTVGGKRAHGCFRKNPGKDGRNVNMTTAQTLSRQSPKPHAKVNAHRFLSRSVKAWCAGAKARGKARPPTCGADS